MSCEQYPAADEQSVWPGDHGNPYRDGGNPSPEGSGPLPPVPDVESDQGDADESGEREGKLLTECSVVPSGALFAWRESIAGRAPRCCPPTELVRGP